MKLKKKNCLRSFFRGSLIVAVFLLGSVIFGCQLKKERTSTSASDLSDFQPVELVYPFLDAANSRWFFFSSASRPFGMVNLSPDTQIGGAWGSGYRYNTDTVKGFSHIHAWQMAGISVMPVVLPESNPEIIFTDYYSPFDHAKEEVVPGYHSLELDRYAIKVELTSTTRVGFHRYQYPAEKEAAVLFHLKGMLGPSEIKNGSIEQISETEIHGKLVNAPTIRRPKELEVYFAVRFNQPVKAILKDDANTEHALVTFAETSGEPLLMKVGISYTSKAGALRNLKNELPHWNFEKVVENSKEEWNEMLGRIQVEGDSREDKRRFYTDLWHALQGRRIISDVDGKYIDNTGEFGKVKEVPLDEKGKPLFNHFNSDAFWGAQWTLNTLWHLVYPEISEQFVNSLLLYYEDGGLVPRGPSGGNYTFVMTGAPATPFIVSAYQKGIRGFDVEKAYQGLRKNHLPGGIMEKAGYEHETALGGGLQHYLDKGYVPYPIPEGNFGFHQDGASLTLEYAYQDWTLAQFAKALGKEEDYHYFLGRSKNYRNQFDEQTGWMRPRDVEGNWKTPFDPYGYENGFNEANGAQATWFVPHDPQGLANLMGGKEAAVARLQKSFEAAEKLGFTSGTSHEKETHPEYRRIPINYGNQPSIQTAFIFSHLGRPDLTQFWARKVTDTVYKGLSPDVGYKGDEDQGLMGSMAVLAKIGLFQLNGGTEEDPMYEIASPIFDKIKIQLNPDYYPGKEFFIIEVENNAENHPFVGRAVLNGEHLNDFSFRHSALVRGGKLVLRMEAIPGQERP